jgi:6-pyruvoyl-tetrahydropterin synthase
MYLFVDQLTNVDFSYLDASRGLVGETWLANFGLQGALDQQSMVCDFGIVKKTFRQWLDLTLDHKLLIPKHSPALTISNSGANIELTWLSKHGEIALKVPESAITFIDAQEITPTTVANWCISEAKTLIPNSITELDIEFNPELITGYSYHYSHGLKKHTGNCQRIAHGHRSTINIFKNKKRDFDLERMWCESWEDIYIGTSEDISQQDEFNIEFSYQAQQGNFTLSLPKSRCYIVEEDTTVEQITHHIAVTLKQQFPNDEIKVKAFEGIGKGAIYSC